MPYQSLRDYLDVLEERGLLHWIDREVDKDWEIATIGRMLFGAPDRYGAIHHAKWKAEGKPLPAAFFIGADPVQYLVAPSRFGMDELAVAGGNCGKAGGMVKGEAVGL